MYKTVINSPLLRALLLGVALVIVAVLGFMLGAAREGEGHSVQDAYSARTYVSPALGIAFEYSLASPIEEAVSERGDCPSELRTPKDQCDHRYLGVAGKNGTLWFMSAESALFAQHPTPREPSREDTLHTWDIHKYCEQGLYPLSCVKSVNAHGLTVVKVGYLPACNGFEECGDDIFFVIFIETKNPSYPVIAMWYDRSGDQVIPDSVVDQIVDSLRAE